MTLYAELEDIAGELLTEFGRSVTLKRVTPGAFDPATGTYGAGSTASHAFDAVVTDFDSHEIDGTLIRVGDKKLIGQVPIAPLVGDTITDGVDYRVERVLETKPGSVSLMYELHLR